MTYFEIYVLLLVYENMLSFGKPTLDQNEKFFELLKHEIYYGVVYYSYEELKSKIERFIKYYNEKRIKEKLRWMSPVQYRLHILAT